MLSSLNHQRQLLYRENRRITVHHAVKVAQRTLPTLEKLVWVTHRSDKALTGHVARNALAELKTCATRGRRVTRKRAACAWKKIPGMTAGVTSRRPNIRISWRWITRSGTYGHRRPPDERSSIAPRRTGRAIAPRVLGHRNFPAALPSLFTRPDVACRRCAIALNCRGLGKAL